MVTPIFSNTPHSVSPGERLSHTVSGKIAPFLGRRIQVIEGAIRLLAAVGDRGVSYSSVDAAANVPRGTTSNHFRTRDALILGVCEEIETRRQCFWKDPDFCTAHFTVDTLAELLTQYLVTVTTDGTAQNVLARAHTAIIGASQHCSQLQDITARTQQVQLRQIHAWLRQIHPGTPELDAQIITDYMFGSVSQQLLAPREVFQPEPGITALLNSLNSLR